MPWGSGRRAGTGWHSPILPASAQDTQAPLQGRLQQTPSAQNPDSQSLAPLQVAPSDFTPQLPLVQAWLSHWLALVQVVKHFPVAPSQRNGEHWVTGPGLHAPAWQ